MKRSFFAYLSKVQVSYFFLSPPLASFSFLLFYIAAIGRVISRHRWHLFLFFCFICAAIGRVISRHRWHNFFRLIYITAVGRVISRHGWHHFFGCILPPSAELSPSLATSLILATVGIICFIAAVGRLIVVYCFFDS